FFSLRGASCPGRAMTLIAMDNCICERLGRQWEVASQPVHHGYCAVAGRLVIPIDTYLPAAFRSAALIRSCQPAPSAWKWSSTSRSIRSVTCSLALGIDGLVFGSSAGLVVTALKAASAASRGSPGRRGRLAMSSPLLLFALCGAIGQMAAVAEWRLFGLLAATERNREILRDGVAYRPERRTAMRAIAIRLPFAAAAGAPNHQVACRELRPEGPIGRHRSGSCLR